MTNFTPIFLTVLVLYIFSRDIQASNEDIQSGQQHLFLESALAENLVDQCELVPIVHLVHYPGCIPQTITSFACKGYCGSYVQPSGSKLWHLERSCTCCQQVAEKEATMKLECPNLDPPTRTVMVKAPAECLCRSCTDIRKENIKPQELVEALANDND